MIADLQQHRRRLWLAHLSQRGGGAGGHQIGQRVNALEIFRKDAGGPSPVGTGGIVKGNDPPLPPLGAAVAGGVGVQRQIKVIAAPGRLGNGGRGGHIRCVAGKADGVGPQVRLHGVGNEVHEILLRSRAGDVGIVFLRRRTQINIGHGDSPFHSFSSIYMWRREK